MISVKFVSEMTQEESARASGVYQGEPSDRSPPLLLEILKMKQHSLAVEGFIPEGSTLRRYLAVRMGLREISSRQYREEAGAALFKKFCEGDEQILSLDIRDMKSDGLDLLVGILYPDGALTSTKRYSNLEKREVISMCRLSVAIRSKQKKNSCAVKPVLKESSTPVR